MNDLIKMLNDAKTRIDMVMDTLMAREAASTPTPMQQVPNAVPYAVPGMAAPVPVPVAPMAVPNKVPGLTQVPFAVNDFMKEPILVPMQIPSANPSEEPEMIQVPYHVMDYMGTPVLVPAQIQVPAARVHEALTPFAVPGRRVVDESLDALAKMEEE